MTSEETGEKRESIVLLATQLEEAVDGKSEALREIEGIAYNAVGTDDFDNVADLKGAVSDLEMWLEKIQDIAIKANR